MHLRIWQRDLQALKLTIAYQVPKQLPRSSMTVPGTSADISLCMGRKFLFCPKVKEDTSEMQGFFPAVIIRQQREKPLVSSSMVCKKLKPPFWLSSSVVKRTILIAPSKDWESIIRLVAQIQSSCSKKCNCFLDILTNLYEQYKNRTYYD